MDFCILNPIFSTLPLITLFLYTFSMVCLPSMSFVALPESLPFKCLAFYKTWGTLKLRIYVQTSTETAFSISFIYFKTRYQQGKVLKQPATATNSTLSWRKTLPHPRVSSWPWCAVAASGACLAMQLVSLSALCRNTVNSKSAACFLQRKNLPISLLSLFLHHALKLWKQLVRRQERTDKRRITHFRAVSYPS